MTMPFRVTTDEVRSVPVVRVSGELDLSTAPELQDRLSELCSGDRSVVLDLTDLSFIDSSGLGVLVSAHKRLAARGRQIVLAGVQRRPEAVLKMTKLDFFIPMFDDQEQAVSGVLDEGAA